MLVELVSSFIKYNCKLFKKEYIAGMILRSNVCVGNMMIIK